jgi:hypothetical protein
MTHAAVFGTIAAATLAWAIAECCRVLGRQLALARFVWSAGAAAMLIHSASAFAIIYDGSHEVALAETARQTAALTGVNSGSGLYANYAFLAIWIADAAWWWLGPAHRGRTAGAGWARLALFLFMFVNGTVIFADGWMRVLGTACISAVIVAMIARMRVAA